jgi:hypothetical protein
MHHEDTTSWIYMGEWRYSSTIVGLCTRWRWVVSFSPLPLYLPGKNPRYPSDRRLGGSQSRSGSCGEEKHLVPAENQTPAVQPVDRRYTEWAIPPHFDNIKINSVLRFILQLVGSRWIQHLTCEDSSFNTKRRILVQKTSVLEFM